MTVSNSDARGDSSHDGTRPESTGLSEHSAVLVPPPAASQLPPFSPNWGYIWPNPQRGPFPGHWRAHLQLQTQPIFVAGNYDAAVRDATLHLEGEIRWLSGADNRLYGVTLVDYAFDPKSPGVLVPGAWHSSEQEGLHSLYRGAMKQIRNPSDHRPLNLAPGDAFDRIATINYLVETVHQVALQKLVFPFLPQQDGPRSIEALVRIDIDGDGVDEVAVMVSTRQTASDLLILRSEPGFGPVAGRLPAIDGYYGGEFQVADLDGDGLLELLAMSVRQDPNGNHIVSGYVVDFEGHNVVALLADGGRQLASDRRKFEIIRPMDMGGDAVIVSYTQDSALARWRVSGGRLDPC